MSHEGQVGMETLSPDISQNHPQIRFPESGPIFQQADPPTTRVGQLETRPDGNVYKRFHNGLDPDQGYICQFSMERHGKGTSPYSQTVSRAFIH